MMEVKVVDISFLRKVVGARRQKLIKKVAKSHLFN